MNHIYPVAVTATLPLTGPGHSALPVIFIEESYDARGALCLDVVEWASQLSNGHLGTVSVDRHVATVCKFINFYHLYSKDQQRISVYDQTVSIFAYLDFRITGTRHLDNDHPLSPLRWDGCARNTVRAEFRHLTRYFSFLERYLGNGSQTIDHRLFKISTSEIAALRSQDNRDFFQHLASHRKYWADLRDDKDILPRQFRPTNREVGYRPFPDEEEIRRIISEERNPAFKALWILQAYGASHRISEVLQIWQEDILPSDYNREFFGFAPDGMPLVLIAHPTESTWLGTANQKRQTRQAYLLSQYGLKPRSMLPASAPLYAGFKSKRVYGSHKTAKTWWLNTDAAAAFEACIQEIRAFHNRHRTSRKHPYFFVNMFSQDGSLGNPIRVKRIESAWVAACRRVGVLPHMRGRNIHGLRHFTKYHAQQLGISPSMIQIMRGDNSATSQDDYGQCAMSVRKALSNLHSN